MKKLVFALFFISLLLVACKEEGGKTTNVSSSKESTDSGDLSKILSERATTYKVSYDTSALPGSGGEITMAFKGGKIRYDTVTEAEGQKTTTSVFMIDGKNYICMEKPQKMCIISSSGEATPATGTEEIEKNPNNYKMVPLPSKTIAGTTAKCFRVTSGTTSSDVCYSKEGVMLYIKSNEMEMTATSYTTNVPDSTFELPSQPQDLNAMMQKYQQK